MDSSALGDLETSVRQSADSDEICEFLTDVINQRIRRNNLHAVSIVLEHRYAGRHYGILQNIAQLIPLDDPRRKERINILARLPLNRQKFGSFGTVIAEHQAKTVLAESGVRYDFEKQYYAEMLIAFCAVANNSILNRMISEEDRISVLRYVEKYVKPGLGRAGSQWCNRLFCHLAERIQAHNFPRFWKIVMSSVHYSYHCMLTSLTYKVYNGCLKFEDAIEFMKKKSDICAGNESLGFIRPQLSAKIELRFVLALVRMASISDLERVFKAIQKNNLVSDSVMKSVMKEHYEELDTIFVSPRDTGKSLEILCRQTILTREKSCTWRKMLVLDKVVQLEPYTDEMNDLQQRMFIAILACLSYPRHQCTVKGGLPLFRKLITRLFQRIPEYGMDDVCIEFNDYENILIALNGLYSIEVPHKMILYEIEPLWRAKILHAVDLHVMTSGNLSYFRSRQADPAIERKMRREMDVITNLGTLLVFLFGVLNNRRLPVEPHYSSEYLHYQDEIFSDCFTTETMMELTKTQTKPGRRIKFPHRLAFREVDIHWPRTLRNYEASINGGIVEDSESDDDSSDSSEEDSEDESSSDSDAESNAMSIANFGRVVEGESSSDPALSNNPNAEEAESSDESDGEYPADAVSSDEEDQRGDPDWHHSFFRVPSVMNTATMTRAMRKSQRDIRPDDDLRRAYLSLRTPRSFTCWNRLSEDYFVTEETIANRIQTYGSTGSAPWTN